MGCCCCKAKKEKEEDDDPKNETMAMADNRAFPNKYPSVSTQSGGSNIHYEKSMNESEMVENDALISLDVFVGIIEFNPQDELPVLSILEDDNFIALDEIKLENDWIFVVRDLPRGTTTKRPMAGFVPRRFVALRGSMEAERWYFGEMTKEEAEALLNSTNLQHVYLVRKKEASPRLTNGGKDRRSSPISDKERKSAQIFVLSSRKPYAKTSSHKSIYEYADENGDSRYTFVEKEIGTELGSKSLASIIAPPYIHPAAICPSKRKLNRPIPPLPEEVRRSWREIPRSQIDVREEIGGGHFGVVHKGIWTPPDKNSEIKVAVKVLKKNVESRKMLFYQEAFLMKGLTHKNLVRLCGVCSANGAPLWIVTEWVEGGSMKKFLERRKAKGKLFPEKILANVCAQIADGMSYLEERKIVHRDLAARNVLVSEESKDPNPILLVKIADFGRAKVIDPSKPKNPCEQRMMLMENIPTKWTAPEALQNLDYSTASDVWSFGIVVHEVFTHGLEPYGILLHSAVRNHVVVRKNILQQSPSIPDRAYAMMKRCFDFDPKKRPTFRELLQFFKSYQPSNSPIRKSRY